MQLLYLLAPYVVWLYPIGVLILLVYLRTWVVASRDLRASLFSLEREVAVARMRRAATGAFGTFGALIALFFVQFYVGSRVDISHYIRSTPTPTLDLHSVYVPTPGTGTPTAPEVRPPTATPTRRPTLRAITLIPSPTSESLPTETSIAPPPNCPDTGVQLLQPGQGAQVSGVVDIRGTANIPSFQFYKLELGLGEQPSRWATLNDVHRSPVANGLLDVWDTTELPAGSYTLRLVVVDMTGNYPPPCEVQVYVTH